jgi:hypothetical protein
MFGVYHGKSAGNVSIRNSPDKRTGPKAGCGREKAVEGFDGCVVLII